MALLQHTRLISKVFKSRLTVLSHINNSRRHNTEGSSGGAPYRPYPAAKYQWPETAEYWSSQGIKSQSEQDDEYEKEEIYLSEIEERLKTYDKKYCDDDKIKELYNEFGWEQIDDRATINYGDTTLAGEQYGPGKKLDPSHYVTPSWCNVNRKPIPPIQYMSADQIRRSRGSLASVRELPPETESIWKYWNGYSCLGVFGTIMITKEYFVTGGHDMFEAILLWSIFGTVAALASDWYAWWHTLLMQESYDKEYFPLLKAVKAYNEKLETINSKPNEKRLMAQMQQYRELIAEKVLNKTLGNRLARIVESTVTKLEAKINEEATTKKAAEDSFKRNALQDTVDYFEDETVRQNFMRDALTQFCSGDVAKITNSTATVSYQSDIFESQYKSNYEKAKQDFLSEQKAKGTLSPVFMDQSDRSSQFMSTSEKESVYQSKINEWASKHNPVNAATPSFS